jgi:hypothetical protein
MRQNYFAAPSAFILKWRDLRVSNAADYQFK